MDAKQARLLLKKAALTTADCSVSGFMREGMEFIRGFDPRTECHTLSVYPPRSDFRVVFKFEIANETYEKHSEEEVDQFCAKEVMRLAEFMNRATKT